jgi:Viral BACON domain
LNGLLRKCKTAQLLGCCHFRMRGRRERRGLRRSIQLYGMVRHVLVKVGEHQQEFQHPVAMLRLGIAGFLFEILHDSQRVGQKPLNVRRIHGPPLAAAVKGSIGAEKRVVQKMFEAQLFVRQSRRDRTRTPRSPATCNARRVHGKPQSPHANFFVARAGETTTTILQPRKYPRRDCCRNQRNFGYNIPPAVEENMVRSSPERRTMNRFAAILLVTASAGFAGCGGGSSQTTKSTIQLSQASLSYGASFGIANDPAPQSVNLTVPSGGVLPFTAASDSAWLTVNPQTGSAPQPLSIFAVVGSLTVGTYTGHITVTAPGAQGSPATITVTFVVARAPANAPFWAQWGANPQHGGMVGVAGQNAANQLADIVYDPFVRQEQAEISGGDLTVHYQAPLTDGNDVYMETKAGIYWSCSPAGAWQNGSMCGPNTWSTEQWNEARFTWQGGKLVQLWAFASDWKPEPNGSGLNGWEPVFHPVDANGFLYVPGAGGTVWKVNEANGASAAHINPFSGTGVVTANTYVAGPLTADSAGNIYYNVIELADPSAGDPWQNDIKSAWLVKVTPADTAPPPLSFASLVPGAPAGTASTCPGKFSSANPLPWPPAANVVPPTILCGSQRPGTNIAPAVAPDGTIFTASRAHFDGMQAYLIAVKSDFSGAKWVASLQNRLNDGCGTIVPIATNNSTPNSCRPGTTPGVDPTTNAPGSGVIIDQASSSPTALPDGSVIFGAITNYNGFRGHMFKFSSAGVFSGAYDFGWDSTPAVYSHAGTYSIVLKDNHYQTGLYCNGGSLCQNLPDGPYYITQLDPNLSIEWQFQGTNTQSCTRNSNGKVSCKTTNPNGFEWCINMPAVDANGNVYVTSEDGNVYVLPQGHSGVFTTPSANLFLNLAVGAAYTPLSIGPDGKLYIQNDGHMFVVGN